MLQFLVTSKARRRLVVLLWGEKQSGSVNGLAELAEVSFASTHTELKAMQRLQLVRSSRAGSKEVFSANFDHPDAELFTRLAATDAPRRAVPEDHDEALKQKLVSLGAPLRGVKPAVVPAAEVLHVLREGVALARRDAVVARSLPVCMWKQRAHLDGKALSAWSAGAEDKHAFAFFLELAGELGGDRRFGGLAEGLRDLRVTQCRPFFRSVIAGGKTVFPLAKKWGFTINMDLESFRGLFDKFVMHD